MTLRIGVLPLAIVAVFVTSLLVLDEETLPSGFFAVAAQVIPVLVLAYVVEARGFSAALLGARTGIKKTDLMTADVKEKLAEARKLVNWDPKPLPSDLDSSQQEMDERTDEMLGKLQRSDSVLYLAAGLGELISLFAYAANSQSRPLIGFVTALIVLLGWAIVELSKIGTMVVDIAERSRINLFRVERIDASIDDLISRAKDAKTEIRRLEGMLSSSEAGEAKPTPPNEPVPPEPPPDPRP